MSTCDPYLHADADDGEPPPRSASTAESAVELTSPNRMMISVLGRMTRLLAEAEVLTDLVGDAVGLNLHSLRRELVSAGLLAGKAYGAAYLQLREVALAPPLDGTEGKTPQAIFARHYEAVGRTDAVESPDAPRSLWMPRPSELLTSLAPPARGGQCVATTKIGQQCRNNKVRLPISGGMAPACEKHLPADARAAYKAERQRVTDEVADYRRRYAHELLRVWNSLEEYEYHRSGKPGVATEDLPLHQTINSGG